MALDENGNVRSSGWGKAFGDIASAIAGNPRADAEADAFRTNASINKAKLKQVEDQAGDDELFMDAFEGQKVMPGSPVIGGIGPSAPGARDPSTRLFAIDDNGVIQPNKANLSKYGTSVIARMIARNPGKAREIISNFGLASTMGGDDFTDGQALRIRLGSTPQGAVADPSNARTPGQEKAMEDNALFAASAAQRVGAKAGVTKLPGNEEVAGPDNAISLIIAGRNKKKQIIGHTETGEPIYEGDEKKTDEPVGPVSSVSPGESSIAGMLSESGDEIPTSTNADNNTIDDDGAPNGASPEPDPDLDEDGVERDPLAGEQTLPEMLSQSQIINNKNQVAHQQAIARALAKSPEYEQTVNPDGSVSFKKKEVVLPEPPKLEGNTPQAIDKINRMLRPDKPRTFDQVQRQREIVSNWKSQAINKVKKETMENNGDTIMSDLHASSLVDEMEIVRKKLEQEGYPSDVAMEAAHSIVIKAYKSVYEMSHQIVGSPNVVRLDDNRSLFDWLLDKQDPVKMTSAEDFQRSIKSSLGSYPSAGKREYSDGAEATVGDVAHERPELVGLARDIAFWEAIVANPENGYSAPDPKSPSKEYVHHVVTPDQVPLIRAKIEAAKIKIQKAQEEYHSK